MPKPNPIELVISREDFHPACTQGRMLANGKLFCFTLEDLDRGLDSKMSLEQIKGIKVFGKTAIPVGRYKVGRAWWTKHKRWVPHIEGVPGYDGIYIHSGVTADDSLGCPLVGEHVFNDRTTNTTEARKKLDDLILTQISNGGEVYITITRKEGYKLAIAA